MSNHRHGSPSHSKTHTTPSRMSRRQSRRRRLAKWSGGLASVTIGAFSVAFFSTLGDHAGGTLTEPRVSGQPVQVDYIGTAVPEDRVLVCPRRMMLTGPQLRTLNSNPAANSSYGWLIRHGAVATGMVNIQLVVQGNRTHTVRILNIQPTEHCTSPLRGTIFYSPSAGSNPITQLNVNLDDPNASVFPPSHIGNAMRRQPIPSLTSFPSRLTQQCAESTPALRAGDFKVALFEMIVTWCRIGWCYVA
jgi:hypothetical protein